MVAIRKDLVYNAIKKAFVLLDINIHNNVDKQCEFLKQAVLADNSLAKDEKSEAIKKLVEDYDYEKVLLYEVTKRICENCHEECLATLYSKSFKNKIFKLDIWKR